jgi:hypothetical protein
MAKEVRIELTAAQKAKIKAATGKTLSEIRVSSLGKNLAVHAKSLRANLTRANLQSPSARVGSQSPRGVDSASLRSELQRTALKGTALRSGEDV